MTSCPYAQSRCIDELERYSSGCAWSEDYRCPYQKPNQQLDAEDVDVDGAKLSAPQIISFLVGFGLLISGSPVLCVLGLVLMFGGVRNVLR